MTNALLIAALALSAVTDVRVEVLSGPAIAGTLVAVRSDEVVVASDGREISVPFDRLLRVRMLDTVSTEPAAPWIELRDGSIIPIVEFRVHNEDASLTLPGTMTPISVPIDEVAVVRLQSPTRRTRAQWRELRLALPPSDLLVVRRDDAIDYLAGVLGDVNETDVLFTLDGDIIPVSIKKIDGLLYFRSTPVDLPASLCTLTADNGLRLVVQQIKLIGHHFQATTVSGVPLSVPVDSVAAIDFSSNKLRYLSELEPRSQTIVPLIAWPDRSVALKESEGPLSDRGFFSNKLAIRTPITLHGRRTWKVATYDRGLALRSRTKLEYRLPKGFRRFVAVAGIDAELGGRGEVRLEINVDGKTLYNDFVRGASDPIALDLDVSDARRLTISVDFGERGESGDRLYLCDARITK